MQPDGDVETVPSPGWYPAPDRAGWLRYWDGTNWTAHAAPGPPGAFGPLGAWAQPIPRTNPLAIASLVCGVVGIGLCGMPSIVGIVLGHSARRQIRESEGRESGDGIALAGLIAGYATVLFVMVMVAVWLFALDRAFDMP